MKKTLVMLLALGFLASGIHGAAAFSTEQRSDRNADGTAKFADPDDQMPNFVTKFDDGEPSSRASTFDENPVTPPSYGDSNAGAAAFNRANAHMENSH